MKTWINIVKLHMLCLQQQVWKLRTVIWLIKGYTILSAMLKMALRNSINEKHSNV